MRKSVIDLLWNVSQYPCLLVGLCDVREGQSELKATKTLQPGIYRLNIHVQEPEHNQLLVVFLDGVPIDSLGVPFWGDSDDNWPESRRDNVKGEQLAFTSNVKERYGLKEYYNARKSEARVWTLDTVFTVTQEKSVRLEIQNHNGDRCGPQFYMGDGVLVLGLTLESINYQAPDTFSREVPGIPMLDAWGWMAYIDFDNPGLTEASYDAILSEGVERARIWGANLLEFNPATKDGHFFDFESIAGDVPDIQKSKATRWTTEQMKLLFSVCHELGILVELFLFSLGGFAIFNKMSPVERLSFYRQVNRLLGCGSTSGDTFAAIDGVIYEMFPHDGPRQTDDAWAENPGLSQMVSGGITGTAMELKNNGFSTAFSNYTAHWVGWYAQHTGYDCLFPAVPYPKAFYERTGEVGYSYLQGCAESHRPCESQMLRTAYMKTGFPSRAVSADWIVTQIQSYAQRRWRDETDRQASALCWEAIGDAVCPEETKRVVYAASQDPIRACVTGQLTDTGAGGMIELKRLLKKLPTQDMARLLPRHPFPASSRYLRNQDLEVLHLHGKDFNLLRMDLSRSARFYANGMLVTPLSPLFVTGANDDVVLSADSNYRVIEHGGPIARIEEQLKVKTDKHEHLEVRRFELRSDLPGVRISAHRTRVSDCTDVPVSVSTLLGVDSRYACKIQSLRSTTAIVELTDADGILPDGIIRIRVEHTEIKELLTQDGLTLVTPLMQSHHISVDILFAQGHWRQTGTQGLIDNEKAIWHLPRIESPIAGEEVEIFSNATIPMTTPLAMYARPAVPMRVRESGYWHYRGIAPSDELPKCNFLKINHRTDDKVLVAEEEHWIGNEVTWGVGSQYLCLLSDVNRNEQWLSMTVRVVNTSPYVFAPRIRVKNTTSEIKLNGSLWHYADGDTIYLPNKRGSYNLSWRYGPVTTPRLCRTYATITRTEVTGNSLLIFAEKPPHVTVDPELHAYYALTEFEGNRKVVPFALGKVTLPLND